MVEFVPYLIDNLPRPTTLRQCVDRAVEAVGLFAALDEQRLAMMDFKPGQWMARLDGSLALSLPLRRIASTNNFRSKSNKSYNLSSSSK